jgi:hypothetical protein
LQYLFISLYLSISPPIHPPIHPFIHLSIPLHFPGGEHAPTLTNLPDRHLARWCQSAKSAMGPRAETSQGAADKSSNENLHFPSVLVYWRLLHTSVCSVSEIKAHTNTYSRSVVYIHIVWYCHIVLYVQYTICNVVKTCFLWLICSSRRMEWDSSC